MRLSSLQVYQQSLNGINRASTEIAQTQNQLSTGQRVNIGSDDPTAAARILAVETELVNINRYQKNIDAVDSRLQRTEGTLNSIEKILDRLNQLVIQADGLGMTNIERGNIATEISERLLELVSLTNSQDVNGDYIFSGFQNSKPAFILEDGQYSYQGDEGVRHEKIAEQLTIVGSDNGRNLFDGFMTNDYIPVGEVGINNTGVEQSLTVQVIDQDEYNTIVRGDDIQGFEIKFNLLNEIVPNGQNYSIYRISDGVLVEENTAYDQVTGIIRGGMEINFQMPPSSGDSITIRPIKQTNMLNIIDNIASRVATFEEPSSAVDRGEEDAFDLFVAQSLDAISSIQERVRLSRTSIGARMNTLTAARERQDNLSLIGKQILSDIRDLDYNEAVSNLSFQTLVLETAQQSFVKIANLSLFNYLNS
ncbi:MAG: flagellar hook-associated protein FlgL [Pseudomonadales bacterium]|nr:flagellar hook-associated protein FlgL [Pseudomonadales bacterium]